MSDELQELLKTREVQKPYEYFEQQLTTKLHHFYISQDIKEPSLYTEMIHIIQSAGPSSVIYLHLNTRGGALNTGIQIINTIQASQAHVICSLEGEVASLGTLIFLAADEFVVHDYSIMMFHNYSGIISGKEHEQIAALEATKDWMQSIMAGLYTPFMTPEELQRIRDGADLYFHAPEIRKRLEQMVELLETQNPENPATKSTKQKKSS